MADTSTKPYLIRALYEWCCDNGYTPYLAVAVDRRARVPRQHVKNGEIVMNVSPLATNRLELGNEFISFQARFGGVAQDIAFPVDGVSAIYARETGHGMAFEVTPASDDEADEAAAPSPGGPRPVSAIGPRGGHLVAVDAGDDPDSGDAGEQQDRSKADSPASGAEVIAFRSASSPRRARAAEPPAAPAGTVSKPASIGSIDPASPVTTDAPLEAGDEPRPARSPRAGRRGSRTAAPESAPGPASSSEPASGPASEPAATPAAPTDPAADGGSPDDDGGSGGGASARRGRSRLTRVK